MLLGALKYIEVVDDSTHRLFMKLERQFGKEVLTDKWNNMTRIMQMCGKAAEAASMWSDGNLRYFDVRPDRIGGATHRLGTGARGGQPQQRHGGMVGEEARRHTWGRDVGLAESLLVSHIRGHVAELPAEGHTHKEMKQVGSFLFSQTTACTRDIFLI